MAGRECGSCTVCCGIVGVDELKKGVWQACEHTLHGTGCGIYETRPQSCRNFVCFWLAGLIEGDERRRPDKLGIMFAHGETKEAGPTIFAWEVWPGAAKEIAAKYVLDKLGRKRKVMILTRTGCIVNDLLARDIIKSQRMG